VTRPYDAIVVGAGTIGLTSAWRMARRGQRVAVVDPHPGQGASWVAAGMLAPVTEVHFTEQALLALTMASARRWPSFTAELEADAGCAIGYRTTGTLVVDADEGDRAWSDALYRFQRSLGLEVERLSVRRLRELEPTISPTVRGGLLATGDHLQDWKPWALRATSAAALLSTAVIVWVMLSVGLGARSLPLWWLPITELASAVVIVYLVVRPAGWGTRALGLPILVLVGNMSYTIYIIHWPVYVATGPFSKTDLPWSYWPAELFRLAIIFGLAAASWYLLERPLMRWRRRTLAPAPAPATEEAPAAEPAADVADPAPEPEPAPRERVPQHTGAGPAAE